MFFFALPQKMAYEATQGLEEMELVFKAGDYCPL